MDEAESSLQCGDKHFGLSAFSDATEEYLKVIHYATSIRPIDDSTDISASNDALYRLIDQWRDIKEKEANLLTTNDVENLLHSVFLLTTAVGRLAEVFMVRSAYKEAIGSFKFAFRHLQLNPSSRNIPTFVAVSTKLLLRQAEAHRHINELTDVRICVKSAQELLSRSAISGIERSTLEADCLNALAASAVDDSNFPEAVRYYQDSLKLRKAMHASSEHAKMGAAWVNLASAELLAGNLDDALAHVDLGLAIRLKHHAPSHPLVAAAHYLKARVLQSQGLAHEALPLFEQSLQSRKDAFGSNHPSVMQGLAAKACVLESQGRHDEAAALHEEAQEASRTTGVTIRPREAMPVCNLGASAQPPASNVAVSETDKDPRPATPISTESETAIIPAAVEEESEEQREDRERSERLVALAAAKAERAARETRDREAQQLAASLKREQLLAIQQEKIFRETVERERVRMENDWIAMAREEARSLVVETALRAKDEKLRLARDRKASEEQERVDRRMRDEAAQRAEEERRRQAAIARERSQREEARMRQEKDEREYRERLERAMDDRARERRETDALRQSGQGAVKPPAWYSFRTLFQGLRRKDLDYVRAVSPIKPLSVALPSLSSSGSRPNSVARNSFKHVQLPLSPGNGAFSAAASLDPMWESDILVGGSFVPPASASRKYRIATPGSARSASSQSPPRSPAKLQPLSRDAFFSGGKGPPRSASDMSVASTSSFSTMQSAAPLALVCLSPGKFHLLAKNSLDEEAGLSLRHSMTPAMQPGERYEHEDSDVEHEGDEASLGEGSFAMSLLTLSVDGSIGRRRRQPLLLNVVRPPQKM